MNDLCQGDYVVAPPFGYTIVKGQCDLMETPKGRSIGSRPASQSNDVPSPISTYVLGPTDLNRYTSHNFTNQTLLSGYEPKYHARDFTHKLVAKVK